MKKALIAMFLLALPFFSAFPQKAFGMEPPSLIAVYSTISPIIDGQLGASEWWDAAGYKVNVTGPVGDIETWLYIKHNSSYLYVGLVVWQIFINAFDQFSIYFDEGNNSLYGSGTRDFVFTVNQEDVKSCSGTNLTRDGCWKADPTEFHMFDVEKDFDAKSFHEIDHSTGDWEIEYLEGLSWVDDHWECEFSIPLVGNDGATQDVSDLACAVGDTIGVKIQYFINPGAKNYFYPAGNQNQVLNYTNLCILPPPTIESCDMTGVKKDNFDSGEPVYVNGSCFAPSAYYDFYIVDDVETWINGTSIPTRIPNTAINISSDVLGNIIPTVVWSNPETIGLYDIIIDLNGNGLFDAEIDVLDNNDVQVTAGFVVPELALTAILATLLIISALFVVLRKKHQL